MDEMALKENCNVNVEQPEQMLYNATAITEIAMDLKETCLAADEHLASLRNLTCRAGKSLSSVQHSHRAFLMLAHRLCASVSSLNSCLAHDGKKYHNIQYESDKLLAILHRELTETDGNTALDPGLYWVSDKLRRLEHRQRAAGTGVRGVGGGARTGKFDVNARYPEPWLKNASMDLGSVITLPSVPEDVLASIARPKRTASLTSLKCCRRVKLCLQRAESNSDEEEDSDSEEQNLSRNTLSDSDDRESDSRNSWPCPATSCPLGHIKEEGKI